MSVCGIVLAAGAGSRYGMPKGLVADAAGTPWVARAAGTLAAAGCDPVFVVVGARRAEVAALVPSGARIVEVPDWTEGLAVSVRAGLAAAATTDSAAALVIPVDVPELPASACRRLLGGDVGAGVLRQALYAGVPGHPVLIGRAHWPQIAATVRGDRGAGGYLRAHGAEPVECGDLWSGADVDEPVVREDEPVVRE